MTTVKEAALDLVRRLNEGQEVEYALRMAGFDPDQEHGFPIFPEDPGLHWAECDMLDCSWEDGESIIVERARDAHAAEKTWRVFARREVTE